MERHFECTGCGKCCYGQLPLTLDDALRNADRFPLAMMWTTVRQGAKPYAMTARLGTTVELGKRKHVAVQITPVSYIPPKLACPALAPDGLCSIHADKPVRCKAMPFNPFRDEADQADLLTPRPGWLCDTSDQAPVVYRDKKIIERADFQSEKQALIDQVDIIRAYADRLLANSPHLKGSLKNAANKPRGGYVVLNFSTIVPRLTQTDVTAFARQQLPVLTEFAEKTDGLEGAEDFHRYYRATAAGMKRVLERA